MVSVAVVRSGSCFILMRSESAYQVHQGGCSDTEKLSGLLLSELMSYLVMLIEPPAAADIWLSRRIFVCRISAEKIRLAEIWCQQMICWTFGGTMNSLAYIHICANSRNCTCQLLLHQYRWNVFSTTGLIANSKRSSLSADRLHKITFIHDNCKLAFQ